MYFLCGLQLYKDQTNHPISANTTEEIRNSKGHEKSEEVKRETSSDGTNIVWSFAKVQLVWK